jgi:serine/threonine protein kinase
VYSYGMTCYEILIGELPFNGHPTSDCNLVFKRQRPKVPKFVDDWVQELLNRYWQEDPATRPSFGEIMNIFLANSSTAIKYHLDV